MKYFANQYEYDNWEEIWGSPIIDGKHNGYDIIKTENLPTGEEGKPNEHPFKKFKQ